MTAAQKLEVVEPDYLFSYANERTFLAWTRTALAFLGLGVASAQFLPDTVAGAARHLMDLSLVILGATVSLVARRQYGANDAAMRRNLPLPPSPLGAILTGAVLLAAAAMAVMVVGAAVGAW